MPPKVTVVDKGKGKETEVGGKNLPPERIGTRTRLQLPIIVRGLLLVALALALALVLARKGGEGREGIPKES